MSSWPFLFVAALFFVPPVSLSVYPTFSLAQPATFRITVIVERHAQNRNLCLGYRLMGELDPIRNSCQSVNGEQASRSRTVYWDVRGSGEYEAVAVLTRMEDGQTRRYRSVSPFRVVGPEAEP